MQPLSSVNKEARFDTMSVGVARVTDFSIFLFAYGFFGRFFELAFRPVNGTLHRLYAN